MLAAGLANILTDVYNNGMPNGRYPLGTPEHSRLLRSTTMSDLTILRDCRTIQLSRGKNTLVDQDDFGRLARWSWHAFRSDRPGSLGPEHWYARGSHQWMHRLLAGATDEHHVDHRNGDGLDNRRENLRLCSKTENKRNVRTSWGGSRYKGVSFEPSRNKWKVAIMGADRKRIRIGRFESETDAARAYDEAAIREYGAFACTNRDLYGDY